MQIFTNIKFYKKHATLFASTFPFYDINIRWILVNFAILAVMRLVDSIIFPNLPPTEDFKYQKHVTPFYNLFIMAENQVPQDVDNASTPATPTGKRTSGKKSETTKRKLGKMTVRLLLDHEHALTLASVQLARAGEEIHTIPQMIEEALDRYTDYLQIKKGVELLGTVPKKSPPTK